MEKRFLYKITIEEYQLGAPIGEEYDERTITVSEIHNGNIISEAFTHTRHDKTSLERIIGFLKLALHYRKKQIKQ